MKAIKRRNIIAAASAVVLSTILLIGGSTLANSSVTGADLVKASSLSLNTVTLTETAGNPQSDSEGNITNAAFEIIPGTTQEKDPTVGVSYTQDSYVFVEVRDTSDGLLTWAAANGWTLLESSTADDGTKTYVYYRTVTTESDTAAEWNYESSGTAYYTDSFSVLKDDSVSYSSSITNENIAAVTDDTILTFQAYLAQQKGTRDAENAWLAASGQAEALNETTGIAYTTLEEAVSNVSGTATISLLIDADTAESLRIDSGVSLTIDLNGHTLTPNTSETATVQFDSDGNGGKTTGFLVSTGGSLTITDTDADSSGKVAASGLDYAIYLWNVFTLEGGTIEGHIVMQSSDASLTIEGGTLDNTAQASAAAVNVQRGAVTMTGGAVKGYIGFFVSSKSSVTMSGGTIEATNIGIYTAGTAEVLGGEITAGRGIVCGSGTLTISGGAVAGTTYFLQSNGSNAATTMTISGGAFTGGLDIQEGSGTLTVTGGTYSIDPSDYINSDNCTVTKNDDGTYTAAAKSS